MQSQGIKSTNLQENIQKLKEFKVDSFSYSPQYDYQLRFKNKDVDGILDEFQTDLESQKQLFGLQAELDLSYIDKFKNRKQENKDKY